MDENAIIDKRLFTNESITSQLRPEKVSTDVMTLIGHLNDRSSTQSSSARTLMSLKTLDFAARRVNAIAKRCRDDLDHYSVILESVNSEIKNVEEEIIKYTQELSQEQAHQKRRIEYENISRRINVHSTCDNLLSQISMIDKEFNAAQSELADINEAINRRKDDFATIFDAVTRFQDTLAREAEEKRKAEEKARQDALAAAAAAAKASNNLRGDDDNDDTEDISNENEKEVIEDGSNADVMDDAAAEEAYEEGTVNEIDHVDS